jgi:hypothetical protein
VVEELVPNLISLGGVVRVTQNLLLEQVPVRDLLTILETLADWAPATKNLDILTEHVRQALARTITSFYQTGDGKLHVLTLDQRVEKKVAESLQADRPGTFLAIDPAYAKPSWTTCPLRWRIINPWVFNRCLSVPPRSEAISKNWRPVSFQVWRSFPMMKLSAVPRYK